MEDLADIVTDIKPMFGDGPSTWQVVGEDLINFEEIGLQICDLIQNRDPRIGRTPKSRLRKSKPKKSNVQASRKKVK